MACVLIIDDNDLDRKVARDALTHAGLGVVEAADGVEGLRLLYESRPDLVLLDVLMPGMDGWTVCARLRELSDVPVVMLTSLEREEEMIRGLDLGADDFVSKPISPAHLVARVRAVLRRTRASEATESDLLYQDDRLAIDSAGHRVTRDGERVELTPTEFRLLVALAAAPDRVRPQAALLSEIWGPEYVDDVDFLRVYLWRLRKKLEPESREPALAAHRARLRLSLRDEAVVSPEGRPQPPGEGGAGAVRKRILLVEDDAISLKLMRDVLAAHGYETAEATTGYGALARAAERFDLVVMDIGLPDLDGVEVTRRLKAAPATRAIPVVAVTAYAMPADEQRVRDAGCDVHLTKPLRFGEFLAVVGDLLGGAAAD